MSAASLRIAAYNGARVWGGGEIAQVAVLEGLARRGHEVILYCNHDVVAKPAAERGIETRISYIGGDIALHHAWRFAGDLRRQDPDALILGLYRKNLLAGLGGRLARVPRVVARIEMQDAAPTPKYRYVFRNWVDTIVTIAESVRKIYIEAGYDAERVVTIRNAFEFAAASTPAAEVRRSLGIQPDSLIVGSIGRLVNQKRFDRLLEAMARLPENVHCVIAGEGELRSELESLAAKLGLTDRLHLLGFRRDIPDLLGAFDVMALSSDHEGLAIVITEAMAAGVPIVSTRVSGTEEAFAVTEGDIAPGAIVDFDAQELAEATRHLLSNPDLRRDMGDCGRRLAKRRFSFEKMIDQWESVLRGEL